jgi:hypothetical protein
MSLELLGNTPVAAPKRKRWLRRLSASCKRNPTAQIGMGGRSTGSETLNLHMHCASEEP